MATRVQRLEQELRAYFNQDSRFNVEAYVGAGLHAGTYRVSYRATSTQRKRMFIVKRAFEGEDDAGQLDQERRILQTLQHNAHIVNLVDFPDNPLRMSLKKGAGPSRSTGSGNNRGGRREDGGIWRSVICMEWIGNGTLKRFILQARKHNQPLPNRLIWRFLGCLLHAATGMAWPVTPAPGSAGLSQLEAAKPSRPSQLAHNDLHDGNVMLGDQLPGVDHGITPMLKLIDFGLAGEFVGDGSDPWYGARSNMYDVGLIMCGIILRKQWDGRVLNNPIIVKVLNNKQIKTNAPIWPTGGGPDPVAQILDIDLRRIVSWLMATSKEDRPPLDAALQYVTEQIRIRDAKHPLYRGMPNEADDKIRDLWWRLVNEPDSPPPRRTSVIELS